MFRPEIAELVQFRLHLKQVSASRDGPPDARLQCTAHLHGVLRKLALYPLEPLANPLLQPERRPRQFDGDHEPAPVVKVEAFADRIGRQQDSAVPSSEGLQSRLPFAGRQSPPLPLN